MGIWTECKNCGNDASGDMIYLCKDDNFVFCQECGEGGFNINGNHNCVCPVCSSTSEVRIMGEIDTDADEPDTKCENCGNVDPDDMLYRCKKDDLYFCEQCGDRAWNAFGNNNCVCPECHSTSNVKILGEIGGDEQEEKDIEEDEHDDTHERDSTGENDVINSYTPKSNDSDDDTYSSYEPDDDYSSGSNASYSSGSSDSGGGTAVGWLFVVAVIVIFLFWLGSRSADNSATTPVSQAPVSTYPQQPQQDQTPPPNPYGAGNGQLSFYRTCSFCKVEILKDNDSLGMLPTPGLLVHPECGDSYMLPLIFPAGDLTFSFKDDDGHTWMQDVHVTEGVCMVVKVQYEPPAATVADTPASQEQQQETSATRTFDMQLLSPADHSSYDYPRYTNVEWTAVPQADSYEVELQLANSPYDYSATSYSAMPYSNGGIYRVTGTIVTVQGMGKQVHRLRVKALQNNVVIAQTDWRYFNYSN